MNNMNLTERILIFRTCLAVLVVLKKLSFEQITNESTKTKTLENLQALIKPITDYLNKLYEQENNQNSDS